MLEETFLEDGKGPAREQEEEVLPFDPLKKYLSEVSRYQVLSREEEREIAEKMHRFKDSGSAHKLVVSNLKLVVKIALEYYNSYLNILDLIQEGNVGLVHAVKKYNPYKGTRFSTYASFWIRAYILKHIMDSWSIVKVGTTQGQRKLFYRLNKEKKRLEEAGIFPAPPAIADSLDVKVAEVEEMEKRLSYPDVSLEIPLYDHGEETFADLVKSGDNIEDEVASREKKEILERKVAEFRQTLNDKELFIFNHRTMAEEPTTLQQIGLRFRISRERVRQIEHKVLKKFSDSFQTELRQLDL